MNTLNKIDLADASVYATITSSLVRVEVPAFWERAITGSMYTQPASMHEAALPVAPGFHNEDTCIMAFEMAMPKEMLYGSMMAATLNPDIMAGTDANGFGAMDGRTTDDIAMEAFRTGKTVWFLAANGSYYGTLLDLNTGIARAVGVTAEHVTTLLDMFN